MFRSLFRRIVSPSISCCFNSSDESESTAEPDASGTLPAYTFDTASVTASEIDSILSVGVSYDDFIDLIARYGNDENMQGDVFLRWGYLIHNTLFEDYEKPIMRTALSNFLPSFRTKIHPHNTSKPRTGNVS